jgi:hypothetical protein
MGIGIPRNVRKVRRELGDGDCIVEAVKCGFTTGSVPTNAGMGLDQLLQTVVTTLNGRVSIYSGKGMVAFEQRIRGIGSKRLDDVGHCPGTTIEILIRTDRIPKRTDDVEDLEW